MTRDTLLIIDDSELDLAILNEIFKGLFHVECICQEATQALSFIHKESDRICAALVDICLGRRGAGFTLLQQQGIFEDSQTSYWVLRDCSWLPQVLLCLGFTSRFWIGQLYVFAFRILFSGILFTLSQGLSQEFFPLLATSQRAGQQTLLYGFLSLLAFPFLLRFFTQVFSHFSQAATRRYWRYITLIPVLLAVESLYVSLYDFVLPGVFDLLLPRFFLLVIAVLLLASIRTSQEEVYQGIQIFEKNHQLQQQFTSTENYIRLAQESRQRMEALYQEKRELLAYFAGAGPAKGPGWGSALHR